MNTQKVGGIVKKYKGRPGAIIQVLQDIHSEYNYLPAEAVKEAAAALDVPLSRAFSIATFYGSFSLEPRGRKIVKVCLGTACHIRGGPAVLESLEEALHIKAGQTTEDGEYSIETVRCLGACAMAPLVMVNEEYHGQVDMEKARAMVGDESDEKGRDED